MPPSAPPEPALDPELRPVQGHPRLLYLVTEDWYFCSHRLPVARAARAAGYEVVVAARVRAHADAIRDEGFALRPLSWRRRGDGAAGAVRAIGEIARLYRAERPDLLHHVALKPVLFGSLARRLAFAGAATSPVAIDAVMGLGSGFSAGGLRAGLLQPPLRLGLRLAMVGKGPVIAQNPEDTAALEAIGIDRRRIALIRGSGVDTAHFTPLPEPDDGILAVGFVSRMLRQKGMLDAVAAIRQLRAQGLAVELLLAGPTDPDNPGSLDENEMAALAAEPGVRRLGPVADVREVWRRAAIAVLPSTYGEGVPKTLLEAAACARPIVAADVPGCREAVRDRATGLLVPPHDPAALAAALGALAGDPARRRAMGRAGRAHVEAEFGEALVARQTLAVYQAALRQKQSGR